jgi:hypothetical protein
MTAHVSLCETGVLQVEAHVLIQPEHKEEEIHTFYWIICLMLTYKAITVQNLFFVSTTNEESGYLKILDIRE